MSLYVLKFGGSSVATTARIGHVADIVSGFVAKGHQIVVVTSAMQGVTNQLIELTKAFTSTPISREYDAVVSSGEHVAAGLLSLALIAKGITARSMTAWQIPIEVTGTYSNASITHVEGQKIFDMLSRGIVPVVTGFQGISEDGDVCTIGRGGSDATACAIANAMDADECLIYTDVDGVYTADPRIILNAKKIDEISYDDMIELASWGAKVLQTQSVQIAKEYGVSLRVLSSFVEGNGTKVTKKMRCILGSQFVGIAHSLDLFAIYSDLSDKQSLSVLLKPFRSMIKHFSGMYLITKTIQSEILAILSNAGINAEIDNDIGTVTVVGNIQTNMSYSNVFVKSKIVNPCSITFVVPFQHTLQLVEELHKLYIPSTV